MKCFGWHKIWTVWLCRCQFDFFLAILHNIGCQQWTLEWHRRAEQKKVFGVYEWGKTLMSSSCLLHLVSLTRIESNEIESNRIESNQVDLAAMLSILIAFNCSLCAHNGLWQRFFSIVYSLPDSALVTVCSHFSFLFLFHFTILFCIELLFRLNNFFLSLRIFIHINDRSIATVDRCRKSLC